MPENGILMEGESREDMWIVLEVVVAE